MYKRMLNGSRSRHCRAKERFTETPQRITRTGERPTVLQNCIERSEPVVLIGECGTGMSHLATGVCLAAAGRSAGCDSPRRAALVNELAEAKLNVALLLFLGLDHK
jgi:DNA replication protein DnaC